MVTSSVPSVAFAEEDVIISEEAGAEVVAAAEEAGVTVEAVEEEGSDTVEVNSSAVATEYEVDPESIRFWYGDEEHTDFTVTYNLVDADNEIVSEETGPATTAKETKADCDNPAYLWMKAEIYGKYYYSGKVDNTNEAFVTAPALKHGLKDDAAYETFKSAIADKENELYKLTTDDMADSSVRTVATPMPTEHGQDGLVVYAQTCKLCGKTGYTYTESVENQGHVWKLVGYTDLDNVKIVDGVPVVIDTTYDASYVEKYECTVGTATETKRELVEIKATTGAYAIIKYTGKDADGEAYGKNIKSITIPDSIVTSGDHITNPTKNLPLDLQNVELTKCEEDGYYTVEYYSNEDDLISSERVKVAKHHITETYFQFKTASDATQCSLVTVNGSVTVKNNSCNPNLPVTYTVVTRCKAAGCALTKTSKGYEIGTAAEEQPVTRTKVVSTEDKVAEPEGEHRIDTKAQKFLATYVNATAAQATKLGTTTEDIFEALKAENLDTNVKKGEDTSDCLNAGTVDIDYYCVYCGEYVKTEKANVAAKDHKWPSKPSRENYVEPTCEENGSYDLVYKCERCDAEDTERTQHFGIERLPHTNELSVGVNDTNNANNTNHVSVIVLPNDGSAKVIDDAGSLLKKEIGSVIANSTRRSAAAVVGNVKYDGAVTVEAVSYCDTCGKNEVVLSGNNRSIKVVLEDIQKQDEKGQGGYITLNATYTHSVDGEEVTATTGSFTVPYYSTETAYTGRVVPEEEEEVVLNGLQQGKDGNYYYYVNGVVDEDKTGIVYYNGAQFYVINGALASETEGLTQDVTDQKWYYLSGGKVRTDITGPVWYNGSYFYLTNGQVNTNINGLVPFAGGTFLFAGGQIQDWYDGLWQDPTTGKWYYLAAGRYTSEHTGVVFYDGASFYVINGQLATDYNGTVEYNGATFQCVGGQLY
jgi:hypothetical protein